MFLTKNLNSFQMLIIYLMFFFLLMIISEDIEKKAAFENDRWWLFFYYDLRSTYWKMLDSVVSLLYRIWQNVNLTLYTLIFWIKFSVYLLEGKHRSSLFLVRFPIFVQHQWINHHLLLLSLYQIQCYILNRIAWSGLMFTGMSVTGYQTGYQL